MSIEVLAPTTRAPTDLTAPVRAMTIYLSTGVGEGPTELAAFDHALHEANVANYNLLCLSSVIPPRARVVRARHRPQPWDHGRRLYVVLSQMRQAAQGAQAHAGIGWVQEGEDGRGLFVELHDERRDRLEENLHATLDAMRRYRDIRFGPVQTAIASATCVAQPVCALAVAVYACDPW